MNFINKTILSLAITAAAGALTSCDSPGDQNRPTYTAARHMRTGSNVPQAPDIASADSVYAPGAGQETVGGNVTNPRGN